MQEIKAPNRRPGEAWPSYSRLRTAAGHRPRHRRLLGCSPRLMGQTSGSELERSPGDQWPGRTHRPGLPHQQFTRGVKMTAAGPGSGTQTGLAEQFGPEGTGPSPCRQPPARPPSPSAWMAQALAFQRNPSGPMTTRTNRTQCPHQFQAWLARGLEDSALLSWNPAALQWGWPGPPAGGRDTWKGPGGDADVQRLVKKG